MEESHCHPDVIRQNLSCPRDVARRQKCIQQGPVWKMEIVSREALIRPSRGTKPMSRLKRYYFSLFFPKEQAASLLHLQKKTSKQRNLRFKNMASSDTGTKQRNQIISFCRKILYSEGSEKELCLSWGVSRKQNSYTDGWVEEILMKGLFALKAGSFRWPTREAEAPKA